MPKPLRYIENEGALFRGPTRAYPEEVYDARTKSWHAYEGAVPKPVDWGEYLTDEQAKEWLAA